MSFISRLLFEDLWLLLIAEFIAIVIVLAVHRRRMTAGTRRAIWITLACSVVLVCLNKFVTTDNECIIEMVTAVAEAVDEGDIPAIAARVDDEFKYRHWDKAGFVAELNGKLQNWRVDEARVGRFEIEIEGDVAKASFRASCDWKGSSDAQAGVASLWTLECVRRPDGWKFRRVLTAKVGPGYRIDLADVWHY